MPILMKLVGLAGGGTTPFDGQYLREYDPGRDGVGPNGEALLAHIVTTSDPAKGMAFADAAHVHEVYTLVDERRPVRPDGKPNRPLTAFTIDVGPV